MEKTDLTKSLARDENNPFTAVPIEITVSVGKARPIVRDLVMLGANAVLKLDKGIEDPVDLFVGEKLIARGMLEEDQEDEKGSLLVRLTEVLDAKSSF
ncbi:MAG: FliM/FliN family flagellar motor switch protein [Lentilitoribacter sp.]